MKYFLRPIISNILLVIESILLFFITSMFILKITVFNKNYVVKKIDSTYYETVYNETQDTMFYIARKSNLKENFVQNVFTIEDVKNDTKQFIDSFYKGEHPEINTELIKENINKNIEDYEEEKNKTIESSIKKDFVNKATSTYKNEIRLLNSFEKESKTFNKYNKLNNTLLLLLVVDLIVLLIINKKIFKKGEYHIILFSSSVSLLITFIYTRLLNIKNLFIYNENVSKIIRKIIISPTYISLIFIIIYTALGIYIIRKKKD